MSSKNGTTRFTANWKAMTVSRSSKGGSISTMTIDRKPTEALVEDVLFSRSAMFLQG